jgi:hypothetical protein
MSKKRNAASSFNLTDMLKKIENSTTPPEINTLTELIFDNFDDNKSGMLEELEFKFFLLYLFVNSQGLNNIPPPPLPVNKDNMIVYLMTVNNYLRKGDLETIVNRTIRSKNRSDKFNFKCREDPGLCEGSSGGGADRSGSGGGGLSSTSANDTQITICINMHGIDMKNDNFVIPQADNLLVINAVPCGVNAFVCSVPSFLRVESQLSLSSREKPVLYNVEPVLNTFITKNSELYADTHESVVHSIKRENPKEKTDRFVEPDECYAKTIPVFNREYSSDPEKITGCSILHWRMEGDLNSILNRCVTSNIYDPSVYSVHLNRSLEAHKIVGEEQYKISETFGLLRDYIVKTFVREIGEPLTDILAKLYTGKFTLRDIHFFFKTLGFNKIIIIDLACRGRNSVATSDDDEKKIQDESKKRYKRFDHGGKRRNTKNKKIKISKRTKKRR